MATRTASRGVGVEACACTETLPGVQIRVEAEGFPNGAQRVGPNDEHETRLQADRAPGDGWPARAIADKLSPAEQDTVEGAVELLRQLADGLLPDRRVV